MATVRRRPFCCKTRLTTSLRGDVFAVSAGLIELPVQAIADRALAPWSGQRNEPQPGFGTASSERKETFFARYSQIEQFGKQLDYTADERDLILLKTKPIKLTNTTRLAKKAPAQPDQQCETRLRRIRARGQTDDPARDQWPRLRSRRRHRQGRGHSTGASDPHFSHRFTTRVDGRGFGLHIAVLAAQEMGGSLTAPSEGAGAGATFVLQLPCQTRRTRVNDGRIITPCA